MTVSPTSPDHAARRSLARRGGAVGAGGVLIAGTAAALLTALAGQAGASATITVDSSGDGAADSTHCSDNTPGNCTIRDAAALAVDGDTITFDAGISSITLTNGKITTAAVNVTGPGASGLTVTTAAAAGTYDAFYFCGTGDVVVSGISFTKNRLKSNNAGKFTLDDVTVSGSLGGFGGALYAINDGDLEIMNSHFENNSGSGGTSGGAVYATNNGDVAIGASRFVSNSAPSISGGGNGSGGSIRLSARVNNFSLSESQVTGNSSGFGGGLSSQNSGTFTISDSNISSNTAQSKGGALYLNGTGLVSIERSTVDGNAAGLGSGGGLFISHAELLVTDSTISNNHAYLGSGGGMSIYASGQVAMNNTTVTGNHAGEGGGIYFSYTNAVNLDQVTIANNDATRGGGVFFYLYGTPSTMELSGTILSGNTASITDTDDVVASGYLTVNSDHSILGNFVPGDFTMNDLGGTIFSTTPGLLALADNGGPTMTMALDPTSAAIDAGPNPVATFTGNGFDQRGTPFVRVVNGIVDIGAFEVQATPPPTSSSTTSTTTVPTSSTTSTTADYDTVIPAFTG